MIDRLGIGERFVVFAGICLVALNYLHFTIVIAVVFAIVADSLRRLWNSRNYWRDRGVAGPKQQFVFGNTLQFLGGVENFDQENIAKFGETFGSNVFGVQQLVTVDLELIRAVTVKEFSHFTNRKPLGVPGVVDNENSVIAHSVSSLRDQRWKDVRTTVTPAFTTGKMKNMLPIFNNCVRIMTTNLEKIVDSGTDFDAKSAFGGLTIDVIAKSAFGVDCDAQNDRDCLFYRNAREIFDVRFSDPRLFFVVCFPNVSRVLQDFFKRQFIKNHINQFFIDIMSSIVAERTTNPRTRNPDFLQLLLNTIRSKELINETQQEMDTDICHAALNQGSRRVEINDMELVGQTAFFIAAGFDTTATTLQLAIFLLAMHPTVQNKCCEEVRTTMGDKEMIDYEDIVKMSYIEQVMLETLRIYPPAARIERQCSKAIVLNGIHFQPGDDFNGAITVIHKNPEYYPEPDKFDPDRFSPEERSRRDPLTFLAFGCGPRNCIGMRFAQLEIRVTLAQLVRRFRFVPNERTPKLPLKMDTAGLTRATDPIFLTVERR